jgi:heme A synthase
MRRALLWIASGVTLLFAAGHSVGTFSEPQSMAQKAAALAMKSMQFELFGEERTYWQMFHGYGVIVIGVALFMAFALFLLSRLEPAQARPLLLALAALQALFAVVGFASFFWAPGLFNAVSAACALAAALKS